MSDIDLDEDPREKAAAQRGRLWALAMQIEAERCKACGAHPKDLKEAQARIDRFMSDDLAEKMAQHIHEVVTQEVLPMNLRALIGEIIRGHRDGDIG